MQFVDVNLEEQTIMINHIDKFQFGEEIFMRTKHVIVEDYNLEWKNEFKRIKNELFIKISHI